MQDGTIDRGNARPIADTLRHIGGGQFLDLASESLAELVSAVDSTGKKGKITLELSVRKATRGGAMVVTGKVKITKPADEPMESMLFATSDGNLVVDDPRQQKLDLKTVAAPGLDSQLKTA